MENFEIYNPVKLHFGAGVVKKLGTAAGAFGRKALLVYGKGSAKVSGAYQVTKDSLIEAGIEVIEYSGIKPNPIIEDVDKAAELAREHKAEMVVAVGGGSVIDSAKIITITIPVTHSGWDFLSGEKKPASGLPLLAVLTLAATGTEMNPYAVVQNDSLKKKLGYGHKLLYPRNSFLDPSFTLSVPANHTAYGIADLIAHTLEVWFGEGDASLSDRFIVAIIQEAMKYGPELMNNLQSYDLRARIMYAATCALNGMTMPGKKSGDWGVHDIGHNLSVKWDIPHGASLSIAYPAWLKLQKDRIPERIAALGKALFNTDNPVDTIYKVEHLFKLIGCPIRLSQAGINTTDSELENLATLMIQNRVNGQNHKLSNTDLKTVVKLMA
ncbi:MAG TPA: iron-containing alcohol dehydrogenase [Bacteroidales bacterium]|nr:iron-containing alcohol dehydrogenase [Bacteroidales bacterium]